jgi:CheY-like chemotaxis protein
MKNECILVIDSNPIDLRLAKEVLEFEGYRALTTSSIQDAETLIEEHKPDLILIDYALPEKSALKLTKKLKTSPATKHHFLVALTGYSKEHKKVAMEAGSDGYIPKPLDTRSLSTKIAELFEKKQTLPD